MITLTEFHLAALLFLAACLGYATHAALAWWRVRRAGLAWDVRPVQACRPRVMRWEEPR